MSVYRRKRRDGTRERDYYADARHRGHRLSGPTGCASKRDAEAFVKRWKAKIDAGAIDAAKPLSYAAAATLWWDQVAQYRADAADLERYLAWLQVNIGKATPLTAITDATVASLVARRRAEGLANASVNRAVVEPLRALLRRAAKIRNTAPPAIDWRMHTLPEAQEIVREASPQTEQAILAAIRPDFAPAVRFVLLTGLRLAEVTGLTWTDVDFFSRTVTVKGKGGRIRAIPMTRAMEALLWAEKDHHPVAVFTYAAARPRRGEPRGGRRPVTYEGLKTQWRRMKARIGLQAFRFHDLRHTAATRLVRATGNLKQAQKLLGHSDIKTTSRYAHVTDDDLRAGMETAQRAADSATQNPTQGTAEKPGR